MSLPEPANFHRLERRVRFRGRLVAVTGLRVGAGGGDVTDAVDLPVLKDGEGYPFLPGASIKGVLRSTLEALVRAEARPPTFWACDPLDKDDACGQHERGERTEVDLDEHCSICRMFGSHVLASHVRITDAMVTKELRRGFVPVERRDGVAIDRDLKIVAGKQKYDFEVVAAGTAFDLEVFVENPDDWMLGLLTVGFDQLHEGFTAVGGFTSRGLGRVQVQWDEATEVTASALLHGEDPTRIDLDAQRGAWREALAEKLGTAKGAA
jgi:CRISPR-associated RAMP protein (TIGR02581 family)